MLYYIFLTIAFLCFLYHTMVHFIEHHYKLKPTKTTHIGIEISMLLGWVSYFFISFNDPITMNIPLLMPLGLVFAVIGFYLFFASSKKVHHRLHSGEGGLIAKGIYKRFRHPMYFGEILLLIGAPILGQGLLTHALSPIFIIQIFIWRHLEEKDLMKEFPKQYADYKKRTWF